MSSSTVAGEQWSAWNQKELFLRVSFFRSDLRTIQKRNTCAGSYAFRWFLRCSSYGAPWCHSRHERANEFAKPTKTAGKNVDDAVLRLPIFSQRRPHFSFYLLIPRPDPRRFFSTVAASVKKKQPPDGGLLFFITIADTERPEQRNIQILLYSFRTKLDSAFQIDGLTTQRLFWSQRKLFISC